MEMDKTKALDAAVKQIEKDFGKGAIMEWNAIMRILRNF